jgi:hypothetical protein
MSEGDHSNVKKRSYNAQKTYADDDNNATENRKKKNAAPGVTEIRDCYIDFNLKIRNPTVLMTVPLQNMLASLQSGGNMQTRFDIAPVEATIVPCGGNDIAQSHVDAIKAILIQNKENLGFSAVIDPDESLNTYASKLPEIIQVC